MGYEKSKIYKLQHEDGHFYIGSSTNELRVRLQQHKDISKKRSPNTRVYKHINNEWEKIKIILIEAFSCENKQELVRKEDEYIQKELNNPLCLNSNRAILTEEERLQYDRNKAKERYYANQEQIKTTAKERYYKKKLNLSLHESEEQT